MMQVESPVNLADGGLKISASDSVRHVNSAKSLRIGHDTTVVGYHHPKAAGCKTKPPLNAQSLDDTGRQTGSIPVMSASFPISKNRASTVSDAYK
jgi:hypothetical protein